MSIHRTCIAGVGMTKFSKPGAGDNYPQTAAQATRDALADGWTVALFGLTLLLLWRTRLNSAWYVLGGAAAGILLGLVGWGMT